MEKSCLEKGLDEWEFLPDTNSFLDLSHGSKRDVLFKELIIDMNYFICPSSHPLIEEKDQNSSSSTAKKKTDEAGDREFKDVVVVVGPAPPILVNHHDVVSQVFFKKLKDSEFVDMKVDSPRSNARGAIVPQVEAPELHVQFSEAKEETAPEHCTIKEEIKIEKEKDQKTGSEIKGKANRREGFGITIGNWRLTGIGAFCSMGAAAAATICIFVFGGRQHQKQLQNHKIQFKIYTDDERMTEAVQQATRLNQALSAVRGAPMTRAHISFGGYYPNV